MSHPREPDLVPRPVPAGDAELKTPTWGLGDVVAGWFLAQVAGLATSAAVIGLSGQSIDEMSLGWLAVGNIGLWVVFLLVPVVATTVKGNGPVVDLGLRIKAWDPPVGALIGAATQFILVPLIYVPILVLLDRNGEDLSAPARDLTDRASNAFGVVVLILIVGIAAPIFEEIFYRGLMQRALQRRYGPTVGVVVTAVVFGLSHFEPLQAPGLILFGLVVGYLALRTGRLGPSIAAHVAFNLVSVGFLLASG